MAELYPETREDAITKVDSLIQIVKSPEIRLYDKMRWGEDPLESLMEIKAMFHTSVISQG